MLRAAVIVAVLAGGLWCSMLTSVGTVEQRPRCPVCKHEKIGTGEGRRADTGQLVTFHGCRKGHLWLDRREP